MTAIFIHCLLGSNLDAVTMNAEAKTILQFHVFVFIFQQSRRLIAVFNVPYSNLCSH